MKANKLTDRDKIIIIAQVYGYFKGEFTSEMLFDFIRYTDFTTFKVEHDKVMIGRLISRSNKFDKKRKKGINHYTLKGKDKK